MYFSVIVPVYGVEPYLCKCLDSILQQDFTDYELILVDDGSPDACPEICDRYAERDARIHVIHKTNGGLVSARQAGIRAAQGEFIINVDSDDWLEPGYFQSAADLLEEYSPDIISFAIQYAYDDHEQTDDEPVAPGLYEGERLKEITDHMLLTPQMTHMHYFVWAKVFRRELILPNQLYVDTRISMGEDVSCLIPTYLAAKRVYISRKIVYHCRCHNSSMSRKFNFAHFSEIERGVKLLREKVPNAPEGFSQAIDRYCAFMCFVLLASAAKAGEKNIDEKLRGIWCDEFTDSFQRATFSGITAKSRIALALLKRKHLKAAYLFLRICAKIKEN